MNLEVARPTEPSKIFTEVRWLMANLVWFFAQRRYHIEELSTESKENLKKVNTLLKNHSAIVYGNHVEEEDWTTIFLTLAELTNAKNLLIPAGLKHYDIERDKKAANFYKALNKLHITFLPVLQNNDKEAELYSAAELALIRAQLIELSSEALGTHGNVLGYTPEGSRNKNNVLTKARTGIGRNEQYHKPDEVFYVPVILEYHKESGKNATFTIGEPKFLPEILDLNALPEGDSLEILKQRARVITDALMYQIAAQLPPEKQGYYSLATRPS